MAGSSVLAVSPDTPVAIARRVVSSARWPAVIGPTRSRMSIAIGAQASSERAIALTVDYTRERTAFGTPIASFQNTKFVLAGLSAKVEAGRHLVDRALEELDAGTLSVADAARV